MGAELFIVKGRTDRNRKTGMMDLIVIFPR